MKTHFMLRRSAGKLFAWLGISVLLACLHVHPIPAQEAGQDQPRAHDEDTYYSFDLRHLSAKDAERELKDKLGKLADNLDIAVDQRNNRILARGSEKGLQAIDEILQQVDVDRGTHSEIHYQLEHLGVEKLEAAMAQMWGKRLRQDRSVNDQDVDAYLASWSDGLALTVKIRRSTGEVTLSGEGAPRAERLLKALDKVQQGPEETSRVVPVRNPLPEALAQAMTIVDEASDQQGSRRGANQENSRRTGFVSRIFQPGQNQNGQDGAQEDEEMQQDQQGGPPGRNQENVAQQNQPADAEGDSALLGPVRIEYMEGLDALIITGHPRDVEKVMQIIENIERLGTETEPTVEFYYMKHVDSSSMSTVISQIYDQVISARQGRVSITSLAKPDALLLIGQPESVKTALDLIRQLDQPVAPSTQFQVFRLKHATSTVARQTITEFFSLRGLLGTTATVTADYRTNSLIVQAGPRDLLEVAELIERLDSPTSAAVNELFVYKLKHSMATELAPILQDAVNSGDSESTATRRRQGGQNQQGGGQGFQIPGGGQFGQFGQQGQFGQGGNQGQGGQGQNQAQRGGQQLDLPKATMLKFYAVDSAGHRSVTSGILTDVRITADTRANALLITAPADSMDLIKSLIAQLDQPPESIAQVKVFTITNGDATNLSTLLQNLLGQPQGQGQQQQLGDTPISSGEESSLLPIRFSVDTRTNSIIATGSAGDLNVVESILYRLDEQDIRQRQTRVYRLRNAPAADVANTINEFLRSDRQIQQQQPGLVSPFEQIEREVVVVAETVSNSLVISATPRFFTEVDRLVKDLDQQPPMVVIQVLIAEVQLNNTDEFGVELGLQDSVLFDRSLLGDLVTTTNSGTQAVAGGGTITTNNQIIQGASLTPGYLFNGPNFPNSGSDLSRATSKATGSQGIANFAVGRTNSELGFGGLVLSASSQNLSVLLRALKESRRLDVLSRPQVTTLNNQPAFIQVGQRVPRIQSVDNTTVVGQTTSTVALENVGLLLAVTPVVSPDGTVVMEVDAENSAVGPEAEGIPVSVSPQGTIVRSPRIDTTTAQTTVSCANGQTIVLGGLLTKRVAQSHRRVPLLSDIPIVGLLFRYDGYTGRKTELMIILTPHVVRTRDDAERIKLEEANRMSWCLSDVERLHGESGLRSRRDDWGNHETVVVYPDMNPLGEQGAVMQPSPDQEMIPPGTQPEGGVPDEFSGSVPESLDQDNLQYDAEPTEIPNSMDSKSAPETIRGGTRDPRLGAPANEDGAYRQRSDRGNYRSTGNGRADGPMLRRDVSQQGMPDSRKDYVQRESRYSAENSDGNESSENRTAARPTSTRRPTVRPARIASLHRPQDNSAAPRGNNRTTSRESSP